MGRLERRLERLENGRNEPCAECGFDGDWSNVEIEVVWDDLDPEGPEDEQPDFCPTCGHQLVWVITWEDLDNLPGGTA